MNLSNSFEFNEIHLGKTNEPGNEHTRSDDGTAVSAMKFRKGTHKIITTDKDTLHKDARFTKSHLFVCDVK